MVRGIRGAITVTQNDSSEILQATRELMEEIIAKNEIAAEDISSVFLTTTPDLTATFPAQAIRSIKDMLFVPLMCASEIAVPGALGKCIRILVHTNTDRAQKDMVHVYMKEATVLRPDLT